MKSKEMQDQYYTCSIQGLKKYFKSKQLGSKLQKKIEAALDASDTKRKEFQKVYIRYTREGQSGYKLIVRRGKNDPASGENSASKNNKTLNRT